jgi:hypothetical protein
MSPGVLPPERTDMSSRITVRDVRIAFGHLLSCALEAGVISDRAEFLLQEGHSYRIKRRMHNGGLGEAFKGLSDGASDGLLGGTAREAHTALRMLRLGIEAAHAARPGAAS